MAATHLQVQLSDYAYQTQRIDLLLSNRHVHHKIHMELNMMLKKVSRFQSG